MTESSDSPKGLSALSNISFESVCKVALILCIIEVFGGGSVSSLMLG